MEDTITCALCGLVCSMQITRTHLMMAHNMTTKEYKALGHATLSPARLEQLRTHALNNPAWNAQRHKYGEEHPNYKGGHLARSGYRVVRRRGKSLLYEHRVVAEEMLGRPLAPDEVVHHKDGNRSNNAPDNLVVMKRQEHDKLRDSTHRYFHTGSECEEAAHALCRLGWPKAKIERALRIHHQTLTRWLSKSG